MISTTSLIPQSTHQLNQHSFQNISQINPTQTFFSSPLDISINHQPNSFDNIKNNLSISTLTSFNSSQLPSMQIDQSYSSHLNSLTPNPHIITSDSFDKFQQELNNEIFYLQSNQNNNQTLLPVSLTTNNIKIQLYKQDNKITQNLVQKLLAILTTHKSFLKL